MPTAPKTICPGAGCNTIVEKGTRCSRHQRQQYQGSTKNRSGDPFYCSAAWIRIRDARRSENPCCQECEKHNIVKAMYAVDHILPRATHPELELEYDNTQSLCERCHNSKTARETVGKLNGIKG